MTASSSEPDWRRVQALFEEVADLDPAARGQRLSESDVDAATRREVEALVAADGGAHALLDEGFVSLEVQPSPSLGPGSLVGPYRLLRPLGEGGMGTVFLAEREQDFRQQVALKVIRGWTGGADAVRRFEAERQILASLDHPHIARLLDGGVTADGQPFFTMEYVEGEPLTAYCEREGLGLEARLDLFARACDAARHAQERLVIHRDLKPSNILVSRSGAVKLLDFGIAKVLDATADLSLTGHGTRLLTPGYGAPEQIQGGLVTTATDVFSLGVVLYELLAGRAPHAGSASLEEVEASVLSEVPTRPSEAETISAHVERSRLEGDLDTICLTALRKEPAERYPTAAALLEDIELYRGGRPIRARPPTLGYQLSKLVRRHQAAVAAGLVAMVTLIALVTVYTLRLAEERDRARIEARKAEAVAAFASELFTFSDPRAARGKEMTVRELLERGAGRAEAELADQPAVKASLQATIGRSYQGLGLYEEATTHLERALATLAKLHPGPHSEKATVTLELAEVMTDRGRYEAAEPLFEAAQTSRVTLFGLDALPVAEVQRAQGAMLTSAGRFAQAEASLRSAVAVARSQGAPWLDGALSDLGFLLHEKNEYDEAEAVYREGLKRARTLRGSVDPGVSELLYNLGQLLRDEARYDESQSLHEEALAVDRKLYGEEHPAVADSMTNLGQLLVARGELEAAATLMHRAYEMRSRLLEPNHPDIGRALARLAQVEHQLGRWTAAEPLYRQTLQHQINSLGPEHPLIAGRMNNLSWVLYDLERFTEAQRWAEKGLALNLKTRAEDSMSVGISKLHLARALGGEGNYAEAIQAGQEALAIGLKAYGPRHPFPASVHNSLAEILLRKGDLPRAKEEARAALEGLTELRDDHLRKSAARATLGRILTAQGRNDEARALLERALQDRQRALPETHPLVERTRGWLKAAGL